MVGAKATRRPRFHIQGEDDANHTASDGSRPARAGGLRPRYQRAHGAEPGREPHRAAHVPCATDPPTEGRGRRLIDQRPDARELDLEPGAPCRPGTGVRGPGLRRSEEHTSELQSLAYLVCRLLLE